MKKIKKIAAFFPLVTASVFSLAQAPVKKPVSATAKWFPIYDFNIASFKKPAIEYGPFARWWWPGNNVEKAELQREINLFADNGFGGVEIQPMAQLFVPGTAAARAKVITWDTPGYYDNVIAVMEEARKRGITVDMTDGSGWPPGGAFLSPDDGFITLAAASADLQGGNTVSIPLPTISNSTASPSRLQAVVAARITPKDKNSKPGTVGLDESSIVTLTKNVKNDSLRWDVPRGNWKLIAFWAKPASQRTMAASASQGPVVNHFDSTKVLKYYNHLFGERTGLKPYFGNPMRAVFDDSYEFAVDRHYAFNFLAYFKKKRGYDITPFLPAEMQRGYNYVTYMKPPGSPDFSFTAEDWRLRYDYDLTLSELFGEQFQTATRNRLEPQGLLHRTQAYGLNLDMMAQAGLASIPETESMLGPEANLKIMSSGAHLYNRPIVSAESVVFAGRAYTTTPQKIKIAVDKLFAAGVNQVIYHGVPYRYTPKELGPEGWYPFSLTTFGTVNFSSNLGEGNIFWQGQKQVNEYIGRTQYALRAGKPHADVLIYFPFMDVDGMPENPEEILAKGYLPGIEGPLTAPAEKLSAAKEKWAATVYPLINKLEANGISWDWVNDASIQDAKLTAGNQISIRGNSYQALVLAEDTTIQLATASKINSLAGNGMQLIGMGTLPTKQPSYLNWKENDRETAAFITSALKVKTSKYLRGQAEIQTWVNGLHKNVKFSREYHFIRQTQRDMADGSRIQFLWNKTDAWHTISLSLDKKYISSYWMNADEGNTSANTGAVISYRLPPYGSVVLYASTKKPIKVTPPALSDKGTVVLTLNKWNLKADSVAIKDTALFDWRINDKLKLSSAAGIYTSSFIWANTNTKPHYYLDLGKVYFTAKVYINGKLAGKRIFAPYQLDISPLLKQGENSIEVHVATGQLNGFIGKANAGDSYYKQFRKMEAQVMAAGLLGPVVIKKVVK